MIRRLPLLASVLMTLWVSVALAAAGLAHRVPQPQDLAAGMIALISPADFCGTAHEAALGDDCPLCHLPGGAPDTGVPRLVLDAGFVAFAAVGATGENPHPARVRDPGHGLRAPPSVV